MKLALVTQDTGDWSRLVGEGAKLYGLRGLEEDYGDYVSKLPHVSLACRLTLREERACYQLLQRAGSEEQDGCWRRRPNTATKKTKFRWAEKPFALQARDDLASPETSDHPSL